MMQQTDNRNNGEGEYQSFMDKALPFQMGADVAKYFVEAGKSLLDLLMRCNFRDDRKRLAYLEDIDYCRRYHDNDGLIEITTHLASSDSNNAMRIERFLAGITAGASRNGKAPEGGKSIFDLSKYSKPKVSNNGESSNS
jgi:hypothetical protein